MNRLVSLEELAAAVTNGATLALGGFQLSRVPVALIKAVAARGGRHLTTVSGPDPLALDILSATGALRAADCGFIGFQYEDGFVSAPALRRGVATGEVSLRQRDVWDTIEQLRAAARTGRTVADFALLHAQRADEAGNLDIDDPVLDVLLAEASGSVLATAEQQVGRIARPTIRGNRVLGVTVVPGGAAPSACFGYYPRDPQGVRAWLAGDARGPFSAAANREIPEPPAATTTGSRYIPATAGVSRDHAARADTYIVNLARLVNDDEVIVTGLASAVPMLAIALAQRTHAPRARYINCIGAVNPRLERAWPASVEPELLHDCAERVGLADIFDMARKGDIDAMFFGAAQVDAAGAINLERIGPADAPKVRLPGPAGSPSMRSWVRRVLIAVPRQSSRNIVARVDAATSTPSPRNEETVLVTDLALWRLRSGALAPDALTPGTDARTLLSATGFSVSTEQAGVMPPPSDVELATLRRIDREGLRYRLLPPHPSSRAVVQRQQLATNEKVFHER